MLIRSAALALLILLSTPATFADVVQLKDKAAVAGKILAEKRDQVIVDLGYTVLAVPRNQIIRIVKGESLDRVTNQASAAVAVAPTDNNPGIFQSPGTAAAERSVRELVGQLGEAVVQVRTPGGLGSGFIIKEDGYLITNFHVIENETQISVEVYRQQDGQLERKSYKQVKIVAINKFADLALLKIEDKDAPKFAKVLLGDADALAVGERVFAIGSPLGLERTVTEGIVSTKTRPMQGELYLQTTAQINPGNSGGPLFNLLGAVVCDTCMTSSFCSRLGLRIRVVAC